MAAGFGVAAFHGFHVAACGLPRAGLGRRLCDFVTVDVAGFLTFDGLVKWFQIHIQREDVLPWIPADAPLQRLICFFEVLAQLCLLFIAATHKTMVRGSFGLLRTFCDDAGAEGLSWKILSTDPVLSVALKAWARMEGVHQQRLSVSHIPGQDSHVADGLSRQHPPENFGFQADDRVQISLSELLTFDARLTLLPRDESWPASHSC